jgi:hypothetical protein
MEHNPRYYLSHAVYHLRRAREARREGELAAALYRLHLGMIWANSAERALVEDAARKRERGKNCG